MKTVKVVFITLAVLILAVIGAFIAFPKSMAELVVNSDKLGNFSNMDSKTSSYEHYDVKTPDSFKETAMYGISLRLPENAARRDEDKNKSGYHIFESDGLTVNFLEPLASSSGAQVLYMPYDFIGAEQWKRESSALNKETEKNNYAVSSAIRNFTFDDVRTRGGGVFVSAVRLATDKQAFCYYEQAWDFETDGAVGFLDFNGIGCEDQRYWYDLVLYDKADLNDYHVVKISSTDEQLIYQIVNSAKLAER